MSHRILVLEGITDRGAENRLAKPLLVFEALRIGYPWACERFHRFVIDGMADNAESLKKLGVSFYPYLEPSPDADKGLLAGLAEKACRHCHR